MCFALQLNFSASFNYVVVSSWLHASIDAKAGGYPPFQKNVVVSSLFPLFRMLEHSFNIISWSLRGLNYPDCHTAVSEIIAASSCNVLCIQESKLQVIDNATTANIGGFRSLV